ncbi:hypothetical protein VHN57_08330 [Sphingobium sp. WW5]|uniref:hypothetical protein n=1 Tax=unclassified Sphingobium TaxID=2611147 RepID=UPI003C184E80
MTDIIQELRGLIAKATPGPWASRVEPQSYPECDDKDYPATISGGGKHIAFLQERYDANLAQVNDVDAALIVAAINHLPALLDRLEAAERGKAMRDARPNPDWPAATAAMVALAEHGMGADIGELLTHGNPSRGIAPGAIFKMIAAIDAALVGEG